MINPDETMPVNNPHRAYGRKMPAEFAETWTTQHSHSEWIACRDPVRGATSIALSAWGE